MSTIAELVIPADEFALKRTLGAIPNLTIDVERVVAYDPDEVMPYVWFATEERSLETLDDELRADPSIAHVKLLTDLEDKRLYRMEWIEDVTVVVHVLTEEQATILDAVGRRDQWRLRILFPERNSLARVYDVASEEGMNLDIEKIHRLESDRRGRYGLTEAQHETLVTALDAGYYAIPRTTDMAGVAEQLGISHQALSERLRRAHRRLVEEAIEIGPSSNDD